MNLQPPIPVSDDSNLASDWLKREYESRRARNAAFSQRSFSRLLGISSGRLSELLSGKRSMSPRLAKRLSDKLAYAPTQQRELVSFVKREQIHRLRHRRFSNLMNRMPGAEGYARLSEDNFRLISDWYHLAILNLLRTQACKSDPKWMARRLAIEVAVVRKALQRLERLKLIRLTPEGWVRTEEKIESSHDLASLALRTAHRQSLQLAIAALESVELEQRDITSITMAIDPSKIAAAKKLIRNFRRGLSDLMEEGERKEVYQLSVALFPLTKLRKKQ